MQVNERMRERKITLTTSQTFEIKGVGKRAYRILGVATGAINVEGIFSLMPCEARTFEQIPKGFKWM